MIREYYLYNQVLLKLSSLRGNEIITHKIPNHVTLHGTWFGLQTADSNINSNGDVFELWEASDCVVVCAELCPLFSCRPK